MLLIAQTPTNTSCPKPNREHWAFQIFWGEMLIFTVHPIPEQGMPNVYIMSLDKKEQQIHAIALQSRTNYQP